MFCLGEMLKWYFAKSISSENNSSQKVEKFSLSKFAKLGFAPYPPLYPFGPTHAVNPHEFSPKVLNFLLFFIQYSLFAIVAFIEFSNQLIPCLSTLFLKSIHACENWYVNNVPQYVPQMV